MKELLNSSIDKNIENYFYYLRALFAVNRNDVPFYKEQFDILQENGKLYHDINQYFSQIFQQLNINDYFIISLEKTITDKESYSFYTKE
ncbi:MAG: hypothetical protein LBG59_02160 [Candidatus Peribacteria bacterium]|nr:hypothetical protein [Candidatus Peribacteria bacterium]